MATELSHKFGASAIAGSVALDESLLGHGEHAPQVHDERVFDEAGLDVARPAAEVVLLEPRHRAAHRSLDLSTGSHDSPFGGPPAYEGGCPTGGFGGLCEGR
jgi:hypothetical protein